MTFQPQDLLLLSPAEQQEYLLLDESLDIDLYRTNFHEFVKWCFSVTDPGTPYVDNWHVDMMCEYLLAVERGEIKRLIINVPPRSLKSLVVNVAWTAWLLGHNPGERILSTSYSLKLSTDNSIKTRLILEHPFYKKLFPNTRIARDQNEKMQFTTTARGHRQAISTGAKGVTGFGGNILIVDDLSSTDDARSDDVHAGQIEWYDFSFSNRLNNKKTGAIVVIMQRLREDDLTGHLMGQGGWVRVKLPVINESKNDIVFRRFEHRGKVYTFKAGAYLHEERMDRDYIESEKKKGEFYFAGQFLQNPVPAGGGIIKKSWLKPWPCEAEMPRMLYVLQSYDTAFTEKTEGDPTGCLTLGVFDTNRPARAQGAPAWDAAQQLPPVYGIMVLDWWGEHLGFPALKKRVMLDYKATTGRVSRLPFGVNNKHVDLLLIEKKGSGQSLIQELQLAKLPVLEYMPTTDKVVRAHAVSPIVEAGKVYVPEGPKKREFADWVQPWVKEVTSFPRAPHDEAMDTLTQALLKLEHMDFVEIPGVEENKDPDDEPVAYHVQSEESIYG